MIRPTHETFKTIALRVSEIIEDGIADGTFDLDTLGFDFTSETATEEADEICEVDEEDIDTDRHIALLNAVYDGARLATDEETKDWRAVFNRRKFADEAWSSFCANMRGN